MLTENRTKVLIAIIGLIGILGGAFFTNWDKVFPPILPPSPEPASTPTVPSPEPVPEPEPEPEPDEQAEITQRLEELHRGLENNEREMVKAQKEIERLRPFLETDRDAQQAIENQERLLKELEIDREHLQREIDHLHEQR